MLKMLRQACLRTASADAKRTLTPWTVTASCSTPSEVLPSGALHPEHPKFRRVPPTSPQLQTQNLAFIPLGGALTLERCLSTSFLTSAATCTGFSTGSYLASYPWAGLHLEALTPILESGVSIDVIILVKI